MDNEIYQLKRVNVFTTDHMFNITVLTIGKQYVLKLINEYVIVTINSVSPVKLVCCRGISEANNNEMLYTLYTFDNRITDDIEIYEFLNN